MLIGQEEYRGLSHAEVEHARKKYGYNEVVSTKKQGFFGKLLKIAKEPMFLLLLVAASVYFLVGEFADGFIMLASVLVIIMIEFIQTEKTNKALEELNRLSELNVKVMRNGTVKTISSREIVVGDIVLLEEGDKVPADGKILALQGLGVDESVLTGESEVVYKTESEESDGRFRKDYCFSGSFVVNGTAVIQISATGANTEVGKIGASLNKIEEPDSPMTRSLSRLVKTFAIIAISTCVAVTIIIFLTSKELVFGERILAAILAGITIAFSVIPEEIPVVSTVFLTLGARELARKKTLTRDMKAIEGLGAITVLCTDKTGTLTENKMRVEEVFAENEGFYRAAFLACAKSDFDPMETAIKKYCEEKIDGVLPSKIIKEYPFTAQNKMVGQIWEEAGGFLYIKGAFESVLEVCAITESEKKEIIEKAHSFAKKGYRVLAVAKKKMGDGSSFPTGLEKVSKTEFEGLIALVDPVRRGVEKSISECKTAGVRVVMITGDNGETALGIGRKIGLADTDAADYLTGVEIEKMSDAKLRKRVKVTNIFSRVYPEHKTRIVRALQKNGEVVAMTGDGVNDAPALKQADVGIAMGKRGTNVAKEAADLILLDDNFNTIVSAIEQGRTIYRNIKRALAYIIVAHVPIILTALIVPLVGLPVILTPVHIVILELLIDPTSSIIFQRIKADSSIMKEPPHDANEPAISKRTAFRSVLQGVLIFLVVFVVYLLLSLNGVDKAETLAFALLVVSMIVTAHELQGPKITILNIFTVFKDKVSVAINLIVLLVLVSVIYLPIFGQIIGSIPLGITDWGMIVILAFFPVIPFDIAKIITKIIHKNKGH